jgi:hypothetical protein
VASGAAVAAAAAASPTHPIELNPCLGFACRVVSMKLNKAAWRERIRKRKGTGNKEITQGIALFFFLFLVPASPNPSSESQDFRRLKEIM